MTWYRIAVGRSSKLDCDQLDVYLEVLFFVVYMAVFEIDLLLLHKPMPARPDEPYQVGTLAALRVYHAIEKTLTDAPCLDRLGRSMAVCSCLIVPCGL